MKTVRVSCLLFSCILTLTATADNQTHSGRPDAASRVTVAENLGRLPLAFEAGGEHDGKAWFLARGGGYSIRLTPAEAVLDIAGSSLRMTLTGGTGNARGRGAEPLPGKVNTFIGADPARWRTAISTYRKVVFEDVYPGIDLVYYGNPDRLEYDLIIEPGADPGVILLTFDGAEGLEVDSAGDVIICAGGAEFRQQRPRIYQEVDGALDEIEGRFTQLDTRTVGLRLAAYDSDRTLVVDPVISFSTYLGGRRTDGRSAADGGNSIAVDSAGNTYVTGYTSSTDFPTLNPVQGSYQSLNCGIAPGNSTCPAVFVTKFDATGKALVYSTYLGRGVDWGTSIAVDSGGNAFITGNAEDGFPTTAGAFSTTGGGVFVAKLSPEGALIYSAQFGNRTLTEYGRGIAVDAGGNAYVTGMTDSTTFPTVNAYQATAPGGLCLKGTPYVRPCIDAFVAKLNSSGSALVYSTYLGVKDADDTGTAIAVDGAENAYITGFTSAANFPMAGSGAQTTAGGGVDAFLAKLGPSGKVLLYSTYLGGAGEDYAYGVSVNAGGSAFVTGSTTSTSFPVTADALQTSTRDVLPCSAFKSTNSAASWVCRNGGLPPNAEIGALAVDPNNPGTLYAGGTDLFKSTDGGATWTKKSTGLGYNYRYAIAIDPLTPSTLYAGLAYDGLYKSTNGGDTWTESMAPTGGGDHFYAVAVDPATPSTVYAGATSGVFKSTDRGATWAKSSGGLNTPNGYTDFVNALALAPTNPSTLYAGGNYGLYKSTDSGATWTAVNNGIPIGPSGATFGALAVDPSTASIVYAGIRNSSISGVWKSSDGGGSWSQKNTGLSNTDVRAIVVDRSSPSTVYAATAGGVFKSTNGAEAWIEVNGGLSNTAVRALTADPSASSVLYAGTTAGTPAGGDAFIAKVDPSRPGAAGLAYSTLLGGSGTDVGNSVVADASGSVWTAGSTGSANFPVASNAFQRLSGGSTDAFLVKIDPSKSGMAGLLYSSFLGGSGTEAAYGLALDANGSAYLTGTTNSTDFPTVTPFQQAVAQGYDVFITKVLMGDELLLLAGRVRVSVRWRSQYTGQTGQAFALSQKDEFGFFYFSNPSNPEVFVKALDFGADRPYLVFYGGLTDYEYTVTFTVVATGQSVSFTKTPGSYGGGADNATLHHRPGMDNPPEFDATAGDHIPTDSTQLVLSQGRVGVQVTWRSQYTGQTGTAFALPQKDEFGFFYFDSPTNPEVFVKVLDFGADRPYLVFFGGLTDYEYTVTYTILRTGQTLSLKKNAGSYGGGADNTTLLH